MYATIIKNSRTVLISTCLVLAAMSSSLVATADSEPAAKNSVSSKQQVITVMKSYKEALQNLTTEGLVALFTEDSQVFEQGGVEGSFKNYLEHHLGPELRHFKSFAFSDYEISVEVVGHMAFTTETYHYKIVLNADAEGHSREILKKGVATSVLKHKKQGWKIWKTHSSSRKPK